MEYTKKGYRLSTGKIIDPNRGIIGLSETDQEGYIISEGYDSEYLTKSTYWNDEGIDLTNEELKEIALYMSKMWLEYASVL